MERRVTRGYAKKVGVHIPEIIRFAEIAALEGTLEYLGDKEDLGKGLGIIDYSKFRRFAPSQIRSSSVGSLNSSGDGVASTSGDSDSDFETSSDSVQQKKPSKSPLHRKRSDPPPIPKQMQQKRSANVVSPNAEDDDVVPELRDISFEFSTSNRLSDDSSSGETHASYNGNASISQEDQQQQGMQASTSRSIINSCSSIEIPNYSVDEIGETTMCDISIRLKRLKEPGPRLPPQQRREQQSSSSSHSINNSSVIQNSNDNIEVHIHNEEAIRQTPKEPSKPNQCVHPLNVPASDPTHASSVFKNSEYVVDLVNYRDRSEKTFIDSVPEYSSVFQNSYRSETSSNHGIAESTNQSHRHKSATQHHILSSDSNHGIAESTNQSHRHKSATHHHILSSDSNHGIAESTNQSHRHKSATHHHILSSDSNHGIDESTNQLHGHKSATNPHILSSAFENSTPKSDDDCSILVVTDVMAQMNIFDGDESYREFEPQMNSTINANAHQHFWVAKRKEAKDRRFNSAMLMTMRK